MKLDSRQKTIDLSAFAFYQGGQHIPLGETLREIDAIHDRERAIAQEDSLRRQKPLEAALESLVHRQGRVNAAWADALRRFGHHGPAGVVTALLLCLLGIVALVVDAVLLGPGLDALGVSDPVLQWLAAFGLAALSCLAFHLTHESFEPNQLRLEVRIGYRILGVATTVSLLAWGVLRGYQVRFAAQLSQNPLSEFLGSHPVLASIFFCFITLGVPLVGAAVLHYAAPRIRDWHRWHKAQRAHEAVHRELTESRKRLELELATLLSKLLQLNAQQQNWRAQAAQYHERGWRRGARQAPHWVVLLKSSLWGLAGLVAGCALGTYLALLYVALPTGSWLAAYLYYRHQRLHPTHEQFQRQENTHFAVTDTSRVEPTASQKLLPSNTEDDQ